MLEQILIAKVFNFGGICSRSRSGRRLVAHMDLRVPEDYRARLAAGSRGKPTADGLRRTQMAKKAPHFAGPDLPGGPDFELSQHKGAYVFIAFEGYTWCDTCLLQLPHLLAVAWDYALNQSMPPVHFVIVNYRDGSKTETVVAYGKQENIIIPIIADDLYKIQ